MNIKEDKFMREGERVREKFKAEGQVHQSKSSNRGKRNLSEGSEGSHTLERGRLG